MKMISYWKDTREIYRDDEGMIVIIGFYNHKHSQKEDKKCLGVHWGDFPTVRGVLAPTVISENLKNAILTGILHQCLIENRFKEVKIIQEAIEFFSEN